MFKIINEYVDSYQELHDKYPDMEAIVYNLKDDNTIFTGGMLYGISDENAGADMLKRFIKEYPGVSCFLLPTSPIDFNGRPYF